MREYLKNNRVLGPVVRLVAELIRNTKDNRDVRKKYRAYHHVLARNAELKNAYAGKRCFILATGPSIKTQDLTGLSGEISISVSNFFVHPDFKVIAPTFHLFAPSHRPITEEHLVAWFADAEKHFPQNQKVLVSATDRAVVEKHNLFRKQKVYYYLLGNGHADQTRESINLSGVLPKITTVPHVALYLACYLGCRDICLLGCDHNWSLVPGENGHFYEKEENILIKTSRELKSQTRDTETRFKLYAGIWETYKEIARYAFNHGIKIWNCTPGSMLDVFPRKELKEMIN